MCIWSVKTQNGTVNYRSLKLCHLNFYSRIKHQKDHIEEECFGWSGCFTVYNGGHLFNICGTCFIFGFELTLVVPFIFRKVSQLFGVLLIVDEFCPDCIINLDL